MKMDDNTSVVLIMFIGAVSSVAIIWLGNR